MNDRLAKQRAAQTAKGLVTKPPGVPCGTAGKKVKKPNRGQRNAKFAQQRLPNHSAFEASWDAEKVEWAGSLHVRDGEQAMTFMGHAKTLFTLVSSLDRQFRAWVKVKESKK